MLSSRAKEKQSYNKYNCNKITRVADTSVMGRVKRKKHWRLSGLASFNYKYTDTIPVQACPFWIPYIQRVEGKTFGKKKLKEFRVTSTSLQKYKVTVPRGKASSL